MLLSALGTALRDFEESLSQRARRPSHFLTLLKRNDYRPEDMSDSENQEVWCMCIRLFVYFGVTEQEFQQYLGVSPFELRTWVIKAAIPRRGLREYHLRILTELLKKKTPGAH
jgi:hypothetical protein